jgi:hypothetical protein
MGGFPALAVQAPPDPSQGLQRAVQLSQLLQNAPIQRQILQQQAQAGQLENQQRSLQLQDQTLLRSSAKGLDWTDPNTFDKWLNNAQQNGVSPQTLSALALQRAQYKQQLAKTDQDTLAAEKTRNDMLQGHLDAIKGITDPVKRQQQGQLQAQQILASGLARNPQEQAQYQALASGQVPIPSDEDLSMLEAGLQDHSAQVEQQLKQAQQFKEQNQGLEAQQMAANEKAKLPQIQAESGVAPQMAALGVKAKQAEIVQKYAEAAKTRAETENLGQQPIFAYDPRTNTRVQTTRPEAKQLGFTNPVTVNEGAIAKERDATAMTNDVQLNVSRYRTAMQQVYQQPMNGKQMTALTALTPEKLGIDIGHGFGISLPDVIQKVANASAFSVLSKPQKEAVLGYYTTLASVPAAQKALSGIGRSNKEMLDLELRTIPTPLMDGETFDIGMDRFQGNIDQTAAKNVRIPGMPTTRDIRLQNEPAFAAQQQQGNANNLPTISRPLSDLLNQFR